MAFGSRRGALARLDRPPKISSNVRYGLSKSASRRNHLSPSATVDCSPFAGQASGNPSDAAGRLATLPGAYRPRRSRRSASALLLEAIVHVFAHYPTHVFMVTAFIRARSRSISKSVNNSIRGASYHTHAHPFPRCDLDPAVRRLQIDQPNKGGRVDFPYNNGRQHGLFHRGRGSILQQFHI